MGDAKRALSDSSRAAQGLMATALSIFSLSLASRHPHAPSDHDDARQPRAPPNQTRPSSARLPPNTAARSRLMLAGAGRRNRAPAARASSLKRLIVCVNTPSPTPTATPMLSGAFGKPPVVLRTRRGRSSRLDSVERDDYRPYAEPWRVFRE
ncbi:hypothetical protein FRC09_015454 [Ceratobasidium sp. 395]|nr:hypothetical protein FRC09_015454 [Ceratobasidium sp. 395]